MHGHVPSYQIIRFAVSSLLYMSLISLVFVYCSEPPCHLNFQLSGTATKFRDVEIVTI